MENRLRLELLIAVCALLLSGIASVASVYQAHVIAQQFAVTEQQFSATVWPYLTLITTDSPTTIRASLTNDGLGPAIIRSTSVTWDGQKSFDSWRNMAATLVTLPPRPKSPAGPAFVGTTGSLDPGDVIRAGDSLSLFSLNGSKDFTATLEGNAIRHGLTVSICYCSLLGTCWVKTWKARPPNSTALEDVEPALVRRCPAPHGISS